MIIRALLVSLITMILHSCGSDNHTHSYTLPKPNKKVSLTLPKVESKTSSKLSWVKPKSWKFSVGSSMRLASFESPHSSGKIDISVIQLGGDGGGLEANVNRWRTQLKLETSSLLVIQNELEIISGRLGDYQLIQIQNEKLNQAFLCAIIPTGEITLFVKLSASILASMESKTDFISFCSSMTFNN